MKGKDRIYWEGVAKAKSELPPRTKSLEKVFQWLDSAVAFTKAVKGKVEHEEPTEIELYKRWVALKRSP